MKQAHSQHQLSHKEVKYLPSIVKSSQNVCFEFNQEMTTSTNWTVTKTADMSVIVEPYHLLLKHMRHHP